MILGLRFLILLVASLSSLASFGVSRDRGGGECKFPSASKILEQKGQPHLRGSILIQAWEVDFSPTLFSLGSPTSGSYPDFVETLIQSGVETRPVPLLRRKASLRETSAADAYNSLLAAQNADSWIHPAQCLEKLLLGLQGDRIPILQASTEFLAFILKSKDGTHLRIYSYTRNEDGIGRIEPVWRPVEQSLAQGWILYAGLHNHNFRLTGKDLNAVTTPSVPDAEMNLSLGRDNGLQEAWITNGVNTIRIPAEAFSLFRSKY